MSTLTVGALRAGSTPAEVITSGRALTNITTGTFSGAVTVGGNLGIGTTDIEAWASDRGAIQLGTGAAIAFRTSTAATFLELLANAYYDGVSTKYRRSDEEASNLQQVGGQFIFKVAPSSGVDGADTTITWTTALTINNSGLLIPNLPTSAPATAGALWNNGGVVNVA